jgi:SAM-dependent methyltransferase
MKEVDRVSSYQEFPGRPAASKSYEKLRSLRLPSLKGKAFLDVGCNEGFFCGYALFDGASTVVGIDADEKFIAKARERFPSANFIHSSWDNIPQKKFDIIAILSAIHYAENQEQLIERLVGCLTDDGILVIEMGVSDETGSRWVEVERSIDVRRFPTWDKLEEIFAPYAWKHMGPSVRQSGDPIARHVFHLSKFRRTVYLMVEPPGSGKTTIARRLFKKAGVPTISGDKLLSDIATGRRPAQLKIYELLADRFSPHSIDQSIIEIFESGLREEYVNEIVSIFAEDEFAYDGYIPREYKMDFSDSLRRRGLVVVSLEWEAVGVPMLGSARSSAAAESYIESLRALAGPAPQIKAVGHIDIVTAGSGTCVIRGWAFNRLGNPPQEILRIVEGTVVERMKCRVGFLRRDVRERYQLQRDDVGFQIDVRFDEGSDHKAAAANLYGVNDDGSVFGPFSISKKV